MNRRSSLKGIAAFIGLGISSFSIYKWQRFKQPPNLEGLLLKKALIAEIAEVIIPVTDTPGAKDAHVEDFILNMICYCTEAKSQHIFMNGLDDFEEYTQRNYSKNFLQCSTSEKIDICTYFEDQSSYPFEILNKVNNKFLGKPFFVRFKELTVEGYCTSEIGATIGLAYDYIPVNYQGCIPLAKNQKSWATK
ncbi:gluconate 2-dehydrogenase subunit 3 family protein [Pedobacter sp. AW31-3R]|uniref:gluconate 2-dehydrogenase subunit 3 family protein n=1 Tax=Pedobacter sp. AW31-3R TaxID=3445781 RepID=UPI003F9EC123